MLKLIRPMWMVPLLLVGSIAFADSLTLKSAIEETNRNSLVIQRAESVLEEAQWRRTSGLSLFLPTITGNASHLLDKKFMSITIPFGATTSTIPQIMPTTLYSLQANMPLFDGLANVIRLRANNHSVRSSEQELGWTRFSTIRQTVLHFYKALAAESIQVVSVQNLKTLQDHWKDVQALKNAGVSTQYDLLRVETQVSEAESEILNAEDQIELARLKLAEIYGKDREVRYLKGVLPAFDETTIEKLKEFEQPFQNRADLKAMSEKADYFSGMSTASHLFWVPKVSLFGQYQYYNNTNSKWLDSSSFANAYQVGLSLSWNIFDGMTSAAKAGEASQQMIQAEKTLQISRIKASNDFESWKRKYLYYCKVYRARLNDQSRSTEAVRLAKEGRRAGTRTSSELLDAELDLFRARAGVVNAQMGMIESLIQLEMSTGVELVGWGV